MFKSLPFGLSSAQDVFQDIMSEMFEDIEGVEVVEDDMLIWRETKEHDARQQVLKHARHRNLRLNKDKTQIKLEKISYIGHILSKDGLKPDPQKVKAIKTRKTSKDS